MVVAAIILYISNMSPVGKMHSSLVSKPLQADIISPKNDLINQSKKITVGVEPAEPLNSSEPPKKVGLTVDTYA